MTWTPSACRLRDLPRAILERDSRTVVRERSTSNRIARDLLLRETVIRRERLARKPTGTQTTKTTDRVHESPSED
jgi:hypothetical protein